MTLAVNYSRAAENLLDQGYITFDCFKCPAWPDLVETVRRIHPVYVHFPLVVGRGSGDAIDTETRRAAGWSAIETLLERTGTRFVNLHLAPTRHDHPDIPIESEATEHVELLTASLLRDVRAVVERFGAERVIVESIYDDGGTYPRPAYRPDVIRRVVAETGCGFLLDISHARLAASHLGMGAWAYIDALPVERIREIHLTGIQRFDERWVGRLRRANVDARMIGRLAGRRLDHLPLTAEDWTFAERALERVRSGAWGEPLIVALEYGGVGAPWEVLTDPEVLREQVPRLYDLLRMR